MNKKVLFVFWIVLWPGILIKLSDGVQVTSWSYWWFLISEGAWIIAIVVALSSNSKLKEGGYHPATFIASWL